MVVESSVERCLPDLSLPAELVLRLGLDASYISFDPPLNDLDPIAFAGEELLECLLVKARDKPSP